MSSAHQTDKSRVAKRQELSLNFLSKLVMPLILEKHLVVLEYLTTSLKIIE